MKELNSCKEAMAQSIENKYFSVAHLYKDEKAMEMHIHDCYEVYFSVSGGKQFLIDNQVYDIAPGDLFLINQYDSHYLTQIDKELHERIVIMIDPEFMKSEETWVDVIVGKNDSGGCECFTDKSKYNLIFKLERKNGES